MHPFFDIDAYTQRACAGESGEREREEKRKEGKGRERKKREEKKRREKKRERRLYSCQIGNLQSKKGHNMN